MPDPRTVGARRAALLRMSLIFFVGCARAAEPSPAPAAAQQAGGLQAIFGSALVEYWDAREGTTVVDGRVTAWAGRVRGTTVTAKPGEGPTVGADGSFFKGAPVIQTAGGSQLTAKLATPLVAQGARAYFAFVGRLRAPKPPAGGASLVGFDHDSPTGDAGMHVRVDPRQGWLAYYRMGGYSPELETAVPTDTQQHVFEYSLRGDAGVSFYVDGVLAAQWTQATEFPLWLVRPPLQGGIDIITFGPPAWQAQLELSLARIVLLGSVPTDAQRAAFLADARASFDAPYCGDGVQFGREACDDGDADDGNACRNDCTAPRCGPGGDRACQPACAGASCAVQPALDRVAIRARAAYSVADRLSSSYLGPAFRVRRADGEEANIGFGAINAVDGAQLSDFCGGSDCTLAILYDQSGKGHHLPQTSPANQIKVYDGATRSLTQHGGRPILSIRDSGKNVWKWQGLGLAENPDVMVAYVGRLTSAQPGGTIQPIRIGIDDNPDVEGNEIALGYQLHMEALYAGTMGLNWTHLRNQELHRTVYIHMAGRPIAGSMLRVDGNDMTAQTPSHPDQTFHIVNGGGLMIGRHASDRSEAYAELQTAIVYDQVFFNEALWGLETGLQTEPDRCPDDPKKIAPGSCGCGIPEANPCVVPAPSPNRAIPSQPVGGVARLAGPLPGIGASYQESTPGDGFWSELRYAPVDGAHERPRFCDASGSEIPAPSEADLNAPPPTGSSCLGSSAPNECPIDPASIGSVRCQTDGQCPAGLVCGAKCTDAKCIVIEHFCGRQATGCGGLGPEADCQDYTMCTPDGATFTEAEMAARKAQQEADYATKKTSAQIAAIDAQPLNGFAPIDQAAMCLVSDEMAKLNDSASKPSFNTPKKKWDVFFEHALDYDVAAGKNPDQITQLNLGGSAKIAFGGVVWGHRVEGLSAHAGAMLSDCHAGLTASVKVFGEAVVAISADTAQGFNLAISGSGDATTPDGVRGTCKAAREQAKAVLSEVRKANVFQRTVDAYYHEHGLTPQLCTSIVKMAPSKDLQHLGIAPNCDNVHQLPAPTKLELLNVWKEEYDGKAAVLPSYLEAMGVAQQQIKTNGEIALFDAAYPFHVSLLDFDVPIGPITLNLAAEGYGSWSVKGSIAWGVGFDTMNTSTLEGVAETLAGTGGGIADIRAFGGPVMTPKLELGVKLFVGVGVPGVSVGIEGQVTLLTAELPVREVVAAMRVSEDDRRDLTASQWAGAIKPGMVNRNYHWALGYHHKAQLVFTELNGKVDLAARIRILFFKKTFRMNLFSWKGFEQRFDLIVGGNGDALAYSGRTGPRGNDVAYAEIVPITDPDPRTAANGPYPRACEFLPD